MGREKGLRKLVSLLMPFLVSVLIMCASGCDSASKAATAGPAPVNLAASSQETPETIKITIGNLTDKTGPSAGPLSLIAMSLEDMARYYNENSLIPGVRLEVISYDTQLEPASDIPGYEWLRERGADMIFTAIPSAPITLKPRLEKDRQVMFTVVPAREAVEPPEYVFATGTTLCEYHSYTLMKWIAENDPDFPSDRPARIGGAGLPTPYMEATLRGAREYAKAHPDQYEWAGDYTTAFKFNWQTEVEALKNCDYVFPPELMNHFVKEYRNAGYDGKFIGTAINLAFFDFIDKEDLWDKIDGMRLIMPNRWWTEESEVVAMAKDLLERYHPGNAEEIMRTSNGYLTVNSVYIIFEIIRETIEEYGPQGFSSQSLYDTASDFAIIIDDVESDTFSENKRLSRDWFAIFAFDADERDLVRLDPDEWLDVIRTP